jgi:hypothetical protein
VPPPPWQLGGSGLLLAARSTPRGQRPRFPVVLALLRYHSSPVGAYLETACLSFGAQGPSVVEMQVDNLAALQGGQSGWGFPKVGAMLAQQAEGRHSSFFANGWRWRVRAWGPACTIAFDAFTVQTHQGRRVRVPVRLHGSVRLGFCGRQWALVLPRFELQVLPPRPL